MDSHRLEGDRCREKDRDQAGQGQKGFREIANRVAAPGTVSRLALHFWMCASEKMVPWPAAPCGEMKIVARAGGGRRISKLSRRRELPAAAEEGANDASQLVLCLSASLSSEASDDRWRDETAASRTFFCRSDDEAFECDFRDPYCINAFGVYSVNWPSDLLHRSIFQHYTESFLVFSKLHCFIVRGRLCDHLTISPIRADDTVNRQSL
jgi:hypothetical protein